MKLGRILGILAVFLLISTTAFAQEGEPVKNEEFGVTIEPPSKWKVTEGNKKAVANFEHEGSQSQIEVVGTKLMTEKVHDVFFETFHKTLSESNFKQKSQKDKTIGEVEGTKTRYEFKHSGVTLDVVVFEFLKDSTAWLVVGYMQDMEEKKYGDDFKAVVKNMSFSGGSD